MLFNLKFLFGAFTVPTHSVVFDPATVRVRPTLVETPSPVEI